MEAAKRVRTRILHLPAQTSWQVVGFAAYPVALSDALSRLEGRGLVDLREQDDDFSTEFFSQTDLEAALLYARALVKQDGNIMLCSDGLETRGQCELAKAGLAQQGIDLEVVELGTDTPGEVILRDLGPQQPLQQGQKAKLTVTVETSVTGPVQIEALQIQTGERQVVTPELAPGINVVELNLDTDRDPVSSYQVTLTSDQDTRTDNNQAYLNVPIQARPQVAVLGTDNGAMTALSQWLQDVAEVSSWTPGAPLNDTDLLILADGHANQVTSVMVEQVRQAVRQGMGLWILPGPGLIQQGLLGPDSDLADLLPVKPLQYGKQSNPNTTVVFIIDTSGSMKGTRVQLAKEIARMGISHLNGHDKIGIVEFYGARRWAAPIQSAANRLDINRALNRLTAGGGTIILPALEEAHYALLNTRSTTKHIVVISDAGVESADYEAALRKIASDNISVSTVLVGPAAHTGFMADMAQWGRGAFFHAGDRFRLPDMNFKSVQNKSGAPQQQNSDLVTSVFDSSLVSGLVPATLTSPETTLAVTPKAAAQVPLTLTNGRPLLSLWHYGMGQIAFWSTDILHEESTTESWGDLVASQCRQLYRPLQPLWDLTAQQRHEQVTFTVTTGDPSAAQPLQIIVQGGEDEVALVRTPKRIDGRHWTTTLKDLGPGFYQVTLNATTGEMLAQTALAINNTPEVSACQSNTALLQRLETTSMEFASPVLQTYDLRAQALGLALLCLLLHVILRRLPYAWIKRLLPMVLLTLVMSQASSLQAAESPLEAFLQNDQQALMANSSYDYAGLLQQGYGLYRLQEHAQAFAVFGQALNLAQTEEDQKYALAWTLLAAQKANQLEVLVQDLLGDGLLLPYQVKGLLLVYSLQGDLSQAMALHDQVQAADNLSDDFKLEVTRSILNMASINGHAAEAGDLFEQAAARNSDPTVGVGLVKLHLLNGDRDLGRSEMERLSVSNSNPSSLMFLAEQAQQMAFYDLAVNIAEGVMVNSPDYAYQAGLFLVQLKIQRAQPEKAADFLLQITQQLSLTDKQLFEVAQVYEQLGRYSDAMALYETLYQRNDASDVLMRMAWLYEKNNDLNRAYDIWFQLWSQANQEHLLYQVQPRLLDLGARTGRLASLAVQLEHDMMSEGADPKALGLLIDLYVSVGDSISAVELAKQYYGRESVESLQQQQRIYLRCQEFGRCNRVLQRLLEIDPDNTQEYLQQMAVLALERGNERDALEAAAAISSAQDADLVNEEYAAGVLSLMGQTAAAADIYYKMLENEPDNAELWLLWANTAQEAGLGDSAIVRMVQLLNTPNVTDDVFTIAVDGLLNLEADTQVLQFALDEILHRLIQASHKVYFYRLAVDVLEEMQIDQPTPQDLLMLAAPYAPDRRAAFIREAQENCLRDHDLKGQLDLGILLVTMDYQLPPQYYMDLGMQFLAQGQEEVAQALFHHKGLLNDNPSLGIQIVNYYDRHGRFDKAATMTRECLSSMPDNLPLRMRSASFEEVTGDLPRAFRQYRQLYELSMGAMSLENVSDSKATKVQRRQQNVNAGDRYSYIALQGLLVTDNPETPLTGLCQQWGQQILSQLADATTLPPLLFQFWRDCDYLCVASGQLEWADQLARQIMEQCKHSNLNTILVENRCVWGFYPAAMRWTQGLEPSQWPASLTQWIDQTQTHETTSTLVNQLIQSWLQGQSQKARTILKRLPGTPPPGIDVREQNLLDQTVLIAAYVLEDSNQVTPLINRIINDIASAPSKDQPSRVKSLLKMAWIVLPPVERRWLTRELEGRFGRHPDLYMTLEQARGYSGLQDAFSSDKINLESLESLDLVKPDQRMDLIAQAVAQQPPEQRKEFLWQFIATDISFRLSERDIEFLVSLFEAQPAAVSLKNSWSVPSTSPNPQLWLALADNLLKDLPEDPQVNLLAAQARLGVGWAERAIPPAMTFIDAWLEISDPPYQMSGQLLELLSLMPADQLEIILDDVALQQDILGITAQGTYLLAMIHQRLGHQNEALDAMAKVYQMNPDNHTVSRHLNDMFEAAGHYTELAQLLSEHLYSSGQGTSVQWSTLSNLHLQAGDLNLALKATAQDKIEVMRNRSYLFLYQDAQVSDKLQQAYRKFMVDCRLKNFSSYIRWPRPESPGGILGQDYPVLDLPNVTTLLGHEDCLAEDFPRYWRALQPDDRDLNNMADALARISIREHRDEDLLTSLEHQLEHKIASIPKAQALRNHVIAQQIETASLAQIDDLMAQTEATDYDRLYQILQGYEAQGQTRQAKALAKWLCLNLWAGSPKIVGVMPDALDAWCRLDEEAWTELQNNLYTNPFINPGISFDTVFLNRMMEIGRDVDEIAKDLGRYYQSPSPTYYLKLRLSLMKYALIRDDQASYLRHLKALLCDMDRMFGAREVVDFVGITAGVEDPNRVQSYLDQSQTMIQQLLDVQELPTQAAVPHLAMLAVAYFENKNPSSSEEVLAQIVTLLPDHSKLGLWLVDALDRCGRSDDSIKLYEQLKQAGVVPRARLLIAQDKQ